MYEVEPKTRLGEDLSLSLSLSMRCCCALLKRGRGRGAYLLQQDQESLYLLLSRSCFSYGRNV